MRYLVTGGAGFIGSHIVDRLVKDGHDVVIFDNLSTGKIQNINPKATFVDFDISKDEYNRILFDWKFHWEKGFDAVFHLAAMARVQPSIKNPYKYHDVNVNGTLNMLKACVEYGVKKFIYSSSSSVYGNVKDLPTSEDTQLSPMSPYALQKLIGEQYCKLFSDLYNLETICFRYFNVYGERQLTEGAYACVLGIFENQLDNNLPMTIRGDGKQRRDFTHVSDVVDVNIKASRLEMKFLGDVFNIGTGTNYSINEIAKMMDGPTKTISKVKEPFETLADVSKANFVLKYHPKIILRNWIFKQKAKKIRDALKL